MKRLRESLRDHLGIFGPAIVLTLVGFVVAYQFVDPAPPGQLVMGTGQEGGAYYGFGERYREVLARSGIEVNLRATQGSVENIALLEAPSGVDIAFVQSGLKGAARTDQLQALGSLYFEPLWIFHRASLELRQIGDLKETRIAVGKEGSGTRAVALQLLRDNAVVEPPTKLHALGVNAAADALRRGDVDALFFVGSVQSPVVRNLLAAPHVHLMSFERAEAYTRTHRFLSKLRLPQGVIDLEANIPSEDVILLAPTATLVAREGLHPALIDLYLQAAAEIHGPGGLFEKYGQFPSPKYVDFPISKEAQRFFKSGPPFLQRYLPFWAATLVDRVKVMLLPLVALLFPLMKIMPPLYRWRIRSRIYRWYAELQEVERDARVDRTAERIARSLAELERIDAEVSKVSIPASYAHELYNLRFHLDRVQADLRSAGA